MAITFHELRRNLGLAVGSLWLIVVGAGYAAWSLLAVRSFLATSFLVVIGISAVGMYFFGFGIIRGVRQLPFLDSALPSAARRIWLQFALIVAAEVATIVFVVNACNNAHQARFIVPLILVIVGLHFLPLAKLFKVPRYYVTGTLFCAISIGTILSVPASAHIGQSPSWIAIPVTGCGLVSLATAWAGLNEVRRFVLASRALV